MKYAPKVWPATQVITRGHLALGFTWLIQSSSKDKDYKVVMYEGGFKCDCPAFRKCKHIDEVENRLTFDS